MYHSCLEALSVHRAGIRVLVPLTALFVLSFRHGSTVRLRWDCGSASIFSSRAPLGLFSSPAAGVIGETVR